MMTFKRICLAALMISLGMAGTAQADRQYSLAAGSGAQLHIGNGLALPIQPGATVVGGAFPPLLIGVNGAPIVVGTDVQTHNQRITVPAHALHKNAVQQTVGVFASNPSLYAVATNLSYDWPTAPAVFSRDKSVRSDDNFVQLNGAAAGQTIVYNSRVAGKRFGGAGAFALSPGPAAGHVAGSPITIFAIPAALRPAGNPPCTHPAFGGPNAACVAALINAMPTGVAAIGLGLTTLGGGAAITTPGGVPNSTGVGQAPAPGVMVVKAGATPAGTILLSAFTPNGNPGATNMASSVGFPFTTGRITVMATTPLGAPETFVISGDDNRTKGGAGTIQMVAGALSLRPLSGGNANRGWLKLVLVPVAGATVPALSTLSMGIVIVLMMLVPTVYFARRARSQAV